MRDSVEQSKVKEDLDRMLKDSPAPISSSSNVKPAISKLADSETPIPVVDAKNHLLGVITQSSILNALAE